MICKYRINHFDHQSPGPGPGAGPGAGPGVGPGAGAGPGEGAGADDCAPPRIKDATSAAISPTVSAAGVKFTEIATKLKNMMKYMIAAFIFCIFNE